MLHKLRVYTSLIFASFWKQNTILMPTDCHIFINQRNVAGLWLRVATVAKRCKVIHVEKKLRKKMWSHRMQFLSSEIVSNQSFWATIFHPHFCCFWCVIFLKPYTHLKFECFPDWDKSSALSWARGFLNTDQCLSWAGEDSGIRSRPVPPLCWGRDALGCFQDTLLDWAQTDVLVLNHWRHLWKSSSKSCLFSIPGMWMELRVLVTYISAFETCFKRICRSRN